MSDQSSFRRIATISAILSTLMAVAGFVIVTLAVNFNFDLMSDQARLIAMGSQAADLFGWGEFLTVFGYYLLLIPVVLYLWHWLRPQFPNLVNLYTVSGLGFIFIGVLGAIIRASILPEMMRDYAQASGAQQEILAVIFKIFTDLVFDGLGVIEILLIGVWWLGTGLILRNQRRILGIMTAILGVAALGVGIGMIFQIELLIMLEGFIWLFSPLWALWLGIVIWRQ